jgi:hypothetical protein
LNHPYAALVADAIAVAFWLTMLAGLWFFQRWARLIFVVLFALALFTRPFRSASLFSIVVAFLCRSSRHIYAAGDRCHPRDVFSAARAWLLRREGGLTMRSDFC